MRGLPIFTFINKLDRPGQEPMDLIDELEKVLGIRSCPMSWPIGMGDRFRGVYDRQSNEVLAFQTEGEANVKGKLQPKKVTGVSDPALAELISGPHKDIDQGRELQEQLQAELELLEMAGDPFNREEVLKGQLTPIFFGSAMNNFGVERFLERFIEIAPEPHTRLTQTDEVAPTDPRFSGFIFKIQANMDPSHRDRVAFMRICSGHFTRNMTARHVRLNKEIKLSKPLQFFAQERVVVEEAWPGDVIGLLDTSGELRIGDTLAEKGNFEFEGIPSFSPEHFAGLTILDPMKRKQLKKGLEQLSEEGVVQVYKQRGFGDKDPILGAVGALQFEVLQHRLKAEYGVDVKIDKLPYLHARWAVGPGLDPDFFERREDSRCLEDRDGLPVVLFKSDWGLRWAEENYKELKFLKTAPLKRA
jgi:peptide chain release factor 3